MLTTTRREQRTRRQARLTLESLDDRLVLSAGAAGAAAAEAAGAASPHAAVVAQRHEAQIARHEAKLARIHARHEAKLARIEARHEARLAARGHVTPIAFAATAVPLNGHISDPRTAASASSPVVLVSPDSGPINSAIQPILNSTPTPSTEPTSGPLPVNVAATLQSLYTEYENAGSGDFTPSQASDKMLQISGDSVEVSLKLAPGAAFDSALSQLQADGMQVSSSSADYGVINGMLPISQLPAAAQIAASVNPVPAPVLS